MRSVLVRWRFYHHFRTDLDAPVRQRQVGVRTPAVAHDGKDLAAALMTVQEVGDRALLNESVERAFPGAKLELRQDRGSFTFRLAMPRPVPSARSGGAFRWDASLSVSSRRAPVSTNSAVPRSQ